MPAMNGSVRFFAAMLALFSCMLAACHHNPDPDTVLLNAWRLCEKLSYTEAYPLVLESLQAAPGNAVAHYLLGRCFFTQSPPQLTRAKGEYDLALQLLDKNGDLSVLAGKMSEEEFRATLHCDTALALLQTVVEAEKAGMPPRTAVGVMKTALFHVNEGLRFNPASSFLQELSQTLRHLVDVMNESGTFQEAEPEAPHYFI